MRLELHSLLRLLFPIPLLTTIHLSLLFTESESGHPEYPTRTISVSVDNISYLFNPSFVKLFYLPKLFRRIRTSFSKRHRFLLFILFHSHFFLSKRSSGGFFFLLGQQAQSKEELDEDQKDSSQEAGPAGKISLFDQCLSLAPSGTPTKKKRKDKQLDFLMAQSIRKNNHLDPYRLISAERAVQKVGSHKFDDACYRGGVSCRSTCTHEWVPGLHTSAVCVVYRTPDANCREGVLSSWRRKRHTSPLC